MSAASGRTFEYRGWRFNIPEDGEGATPCAPAALVEAALEAVAGRRGAPYRRSRHATTWRVSVADASGTPPLAIVVKQIDAPRGAWDRLRRMLSGARSEHVIRITEYLRRDGFSAPRVLLAGTHCQSGCELLVTQRLRGSMVTRLFNPRYAADLRTRRAILRALGRETARLHQRGYVHGDLTPYNVLVTSQRPIRLAFVDHERTRRAGMLMAKRQQLRNLVQLGHFELPGLMPRDWMRVFASYIRARGLRPRPTLEKVARMIERRRARERLPDPALGAGRLTIPSRAELGKR